MLLSLIKKIQYHWAVTAPKRYICWLRKQGCRVGEGVQFHGLKHIFIDTTRPSLVEIGNNVVFTRGCILLTHGYDWFVLKNLYGELLCSSGRVKIGCNVFLGMNTVILKGVTIGDNVIIGAGSVITHDIPANSVAAGNPAKILCEIEQYYTKRRMAYIEEAKSYARSIKDKLGRNPNENDFWEEFPLFTNDNNDIDNNHKKQQIGLLYTNYHKYHKPHYDSFEAFIADALNA